MDAGRRLAASMPKAAWLGRVYRRKGRERLRAGLLPVEFGGHAADDPGEALGSNNFASEDEDVTVSATWGALTHAGVVRSHNQDAVVCVPPVFAVADGMGGHAAGDVASQIAARHLSSFAGAAGIDGETVTAACRAANAEILHRGRTEPELAGMGTTVAGVALSRTPAGQAVLVFNAGDSRVYCFENGRLTQVSEDHSLVAEMVAAEQISPAEALEHPQRNVVTRALGVEDELVVDTWLFDVSGPQRFLVCSDGLTNEVSDDEIALALERTAEPRRCAEQLLDLALARGARDNVSVIVLDLVPGEQIRNEPVSSLDAETTPRTDLARAVPGALIDSVPGFRTSA